MQLLFVGNESFANNTLNIYCRTIHQVPDEVFCRLLIYNYILLFRVLRNRVRISP